MKIDHALGSTRLDPASLSAELTPLTTAFPLWPRRLAFWAPIVTATVLGTVLGAEATAGVGSPLRLPLLALLAINLAYMAITGVPGLIGVVLALCGRRIRPAASAPTGLSRTALIMPIHNEDPVAVFTGMEVMARAIGEAGLFGIELFVLSDTSDTAIAAREQVLYEALLARLPAGLALHYRRRVNKIGRKAGNVMSFCERWGDGFDYMVVLDADSLMGPSAIARLIGLMDANPGTGIIQTVPYAVGRETLFARMMQFSARLYSPLLVEGLTFWQQSDGNYWGHNAIVRIAPFRAHCVLPVLPGREPWGGEILCHDVVEAGMMRGAGWGVWVLPEVLESYESLPANFADFDARERRWCQGNLQHTRLLARPGVRPVGRFHLGYGVFHYLAAPACLLFLLLASVDAVAGGGFAAALFTGSSGVALIAVGAVLLYAAKGLCLVAALLDPAEARRFGGRTALIASAAVEQVASCMLSALMIVGYTRSVVELLAGRTVRWDAQARDDRGLGWREGWARTRLCTAIGAAWLLLLPFMPGEVRGWTLPLLLGLLAAWPATVLSSRTRLGRAARHLGLFLTPSETDPSPVLRAYDRAMRTPVATGEAPERVPHGSGRALAARVLALLLLTLTLSPTTLAQALPPGLNDGDRTAIEGVIRHQLEAFKQDDAVAAYGFAAPNVKQIFPSPERFIEMVRRGYPPVYRPRSVEFSELALREGEITQEVELVGPDGGAKLAVYTMVRDGQGGWLIAACVLVPSVRVGA